MQHSLWEKAASALTLRPRRLPAGRKRADLPVKHLAVEALEPRCLLDVGPGAPAPRSVDPTIGSYETSSISSLSKDNSGASSWLQADTDERFAWSGWHKAANSVEAQTLVAPGDVPITASGSAVLQYHFGEEPSLEAEQAGYSLAMDGESLWCSPGEPIVPQRTSHILLPEGTRIETASVALSEPTVLARGIELAAAPAFVPTGEQAPPIVETVAASFFRPLSFETQYIRGYSVGVLTILPIAYEAETGTLTYYEDVQVTVTTSALPTFDLLPLRQIAADAESVAGLVDNASALAGYAATEPATGTTSGALPTDGPFEYVIVTPDVMSEALQPLVAHKQSRGLSATLVTTEYIDANYTSPYANEDDLAGRVREFLADAYGNWNTQWVVLAGDADLEGSPIRNVTVSANGYEHTFPTDMYFACLDGPYDYVNDGSWGQSDDGFAGTDVDRGPDLFVGRVPASNVAEATNFVDKTILYETTTPPNAGHALYLGEKLNDTPLWGADSNEYLRQHVVPAYYTASTYYERDEAYTRKDVIDELNASPGFVHHLGHSNYNYNAKLEPEHPPQLTNEHPFLLYSQGCNAGAFQRESMAEAYTVQSEHAAVAVILNTDYGWYSSTGLGGSHRWAQEFFDALFNEHFVSFGEAHIDAKNDLASTGSTGRWIFFTNTLFGDPETPMFIPPDETPNNDLLGTSFAVTPDDLALADGTVEVSFDVHNTGLNATGPFSVRFYLSDDGQIDPATDALLSLSGGADAYRIETALPAGTTHHGTVSLQVPDSDPFSDAWGTLGMVVDADGEFAEDDEGNNCNRGVGLDLADVSFDPFGDPVDPEAPFAQPVAYPGVICFEAEHYHHNTLQGDHAWEEGEAPQGASGEGGMQAVPNIGTLIDEDFVTESPRLDYDVYFQYAGLHHVLVRGYAPSASDASLHVGLDGEPPEDACKIGFDVDHQWVWTGSTPEGSEIVLDVAEPGLHTLNVWMREDGLIVDKFIIVPASAAYWPNTFGPGESPRHVNSPPLAADDFLSVDAFGRLDGQLTAIDTDLWDHLTYRIGLAPAHGLISQLDPVSGAFTYEPDNGYQGADSFTFTVDDGFVESNEATVDLTVTEAATVLGRYVFYNNSAFDGMDATVGPADDAAIAPDKSALLPGETATFANYTSYSRGINGIMVDLFDLPPGAELTAGDFEFRVGNDNNPTTWPLAPPPVVSVRPDDGAYGAARISLVWDDHQIEKEWLQVIVKANQRTGLDQPDVFYFGNSVGETGDSLQNAMVTSSDEILTRHNPRVFQSAAIDNAYDFNRDRRVTAVDQILARGNVTVFEALQLIAVPEQDVLLGTTAIHDAAHLDAARGEVAWLYDFEPEGDTDSPSTDDNAKEQTIALLLTIDRD